MCVYTHVHIHTRQEKGSHHTGEESLHPKEGAVSPLSSWVITPEMAWKTFITPGLYFQPLLSFEVLEGGGGGSPCRPGLFLKSLCLSAQVSSWWRNRPRYTRFVFLPPPATPQQPRARAECEPLFSGRTVPGPPRGLEETGPQERTRNRARLFKLHLQEEETRVGRGRGCWLEEEEKLFLLVQFLRRYWRITQLFGGGGHIRGAKKKKNTPRERRGLSAQWPLQKGDI